MRFVDRVGNRFHRFNAEQKYKESSALNDANWKHELEADHLRILWNPGRAVKERMESGDMLGTSKENKGSHFKNGERAVREIEGKQQRALHRNQSHTGPQEWEHGQLYKDLVERSDKTEKSLWIVQLECTYRKT